MSATRIGQAYQKSSGGGGGITKFARPATYVVAASNSVDTTNADYICTGTNDQNTINTAIAALPSSGGQVLLLDGTFSISGSINIAIPQMILSGQGWGTELNVTNSTNANIINFSPTSGNYLNNVVIRDMYINANGANQTAGDTIYAHGAVWCIFENLWIDVPYLSAIHLYTDNLGSYGHHNIITHCLFQNGTSSAGAGYALMLEQADENMISDNTFQSNGNSSGNNPCHIWDKAGLQSIIGNQFVTGGMAVKLSSGAFTKIVGNTFDGSYGLDQFQNYYAAIHAGTNAILIANNNFYNIGYQANSTNPGVGLIIDNSTDIIVENNVFVPINNATHCKSGIDMLSYPPSNDVVRGNDCTLTGAGSGTFSTAPLLIGGNGHIIEGNLGVQTTISKSSAYAATPLEKVILVTGTTTITLPDATLNTLMQLSIKNVDASDTTTITTTSSQTIDGSTTVTLPVQNTSLNIVSNGTNWDIV